MPIEVTDEMVERIAAVIAAADEDNDGFPWEVMVEHYPATTETCRKQARAAIAAVAPMIEAAEREECAKVADAMKLRAEQANFRGANWLIEGVIAAGRAAVSAASGAIAAAIRSRS